MCFHVDCNGSETCATLAASALYHGGLAWMVPNLTVGSLDPDVAWLHTAAAAPLYTAVPLLQRWMKGDGVLVRVLRVLRPLCGLTSLFCVVFRFNHGKILCRNM